MKPGTVIYLTAEDDGSDPKVTWAGGEPPDSKTLLKLPMLERLVSKGSYKGTRYQKIFDALEKRSADQPRGYALSADSQTLLFWSHHVGHWLIVIPDKTTQKKLIEEYHHNFAQHPTAEQQHQQMRQVFF